MKCPRSSAASWPLLLVASTIGTGPLAGQDRTGDIVAVGDLVRVTDVEDARLIGHVRELGQGWLLIATESSPNDMVRVDLTDVAGIARRERRGNSKLGARIGSGVGMLAALPIALRDRECPLDKDLNSCVTEGLLSAMGITIVGGLAGMAVGAIIGAPIKSDQWVEVEPPVIAPTVGLVPGASSRWFVGLRVRPR